MTESKVIYRINIVLVLQRLLIPLMTAMTNVVHVALAEISVNGDNYLSVSIIPPFLVAKETTLYYLDTFY